MEAVRLVFRAELRRRWRSWLAIALLVTLVGGFVLAATVAGRRTDSAFPRFVATYGFDALAYAAQPVPKLARLPEVASADEDPEPCQRSAAVLLRPPDQSDRLRGGGPPARRTRVLEARLGSLARPVLSGPGPGLDHLAKDYGVRIGTVIRVPFYAPSQLMAFFNATGSPPQPTGPTVALHVVGFEVSEGEFPSGATPSYSLYATPAFARTVAPGTAAFDLYLVRLRHGAADLPAIQRRHLRVERRRRGRLRERGPIQRGHRGVDPSPSHRLVGAGGPGRAGRSSRHRPGVGSPERGRERGLSHLGHPRSRAAPARGAGHGPEPGRGGRRAPSGRWRWPWRCLRSLPWARRASPSPRRAWSSTPSSSPSGSWP